VIYGVLLAPSTYKDSDRLVVLWESNNLKGLLRAAVAPATFRDWREGAHAFEGLEVVARGSPVTVTSSGLPEWANIQCATPALFPLLGIRPAIGRFFLEEELKSANPVRLSYRFWQRRFSGDLNIPGQRITINGEPHTIVGVLPRDFHIFDRETDLWMPIDRPGRDIQARNFRSWMIAVGKLRSGETVRAPPVSSAHRDSRRLECVRRRHRLGRQKSLSLTRLPF
jgi:putative ABC transport system permease protein